MRGYEGLLDMKDEFDLDIHLMDNVNSSYAVTYAVEQLVEQGVSLIFGHGNFYGKYFNNLAKEFPTTHFVYFNGSYHGENLTSFNFNSHAMGFFAGMVAGKETDTHHIGVIAAHEWQPEIEGFYEGVKYENPEANVHIDFVNEWTGQEIVDQIYDDMITEQVDVIYPTGEPFSEHVLDMIKDDQIYGIGYGVDQSYIDQKRVLTSTIQHVDKLYALAIHSAADQSLAGGVYYFDFKDDVVSLGPFSPEIPIEYQHSLNEFIETYKTTNLLPNEL